MNVGILAFSDRGMALAERLRPFFSGRNDQAELTRCPEGGLADWTAAHFSNQALLFIGSAGIAVRAVAPHVRAKTSDPAVIVLDEGAAYVIPLLSGHMGGANRLAAELAGYLGALPVVTTATDLNRVFAIDTWAVDQGLIIANPERIKSVSARLLAGEQIKVASDFPLAGPLPEGLAVSNGGGDVWITYQSGGGAALRLVAPVVTLGLGCKKSTDAETIEAAFQAIIREAGCHSLAVKQVCSIDLKAEEPGMLEFCRCRGLPYRTFAACELSQAEGSLAASAFVRSVTGVDNVCERSALLGSGSGGKLLAGKAAGQGVTLALAIEPYRVCFKK